MERKTTRITVETETLLVVHHARAARDWCPECRAEVEAITLFSDGPAEPTTLAQLKRWLSTGKLHVWQPVAGPTRMCVTSLLQCVELEEIRRSSVTDSTPPYHTRRQEK